MRVMTYIIIAVTLVFAAVYTADAGQAVKDYVFSEGFEDGTVGSWSSYPPAQDTAYDPTLWIRPLLREKDVPNRALYREILADYPIEYVWGARKKLDMYIDSSGVLRFRCMIGSRTAVKGVRLRLGFGDGGDAWLDVPFEEIDVWRSFEIPLAGYVPDGGMRKLDAVAFMAVCPNAAPDTPLVFGLDDVSVKGWRDAGFDFSVPAVHCLDEWRDFIAAGHYAEGGSVTISGTAPVNADRVDVRLSHALTGGGERLYRMKPGRDGVWSVSISLGGSKGPGAGFWRAEVEGSSRSGETFSTPLVFLVRRADAPDSHPRLFFSAGDRERILARASSGHAAEVWKSIRERAATYRRNHDVGDFNYNLDAYDETYWLATFGGYYGAIWVPNAYIRENAVEYALSGSAEAGDAARRGLLKLAGWKTFVHPHILDQGQNTYWPVAIMLTDLALSYDLVHDAMTPDERRIVADALFEKGITQVFKEYVLDNRVSSNTSNWISDAAGAGILGASAIMGEYSDTDLEPYLSGCILKLGALIDNTFDRDGAYGEGALYYSHALHCLTKTMPVLERLYGVRFPDELIARSCDFLIHQTDAATGRIYDYGDAFETIPLFRQDGYLGFGNLAYLAGKYRDPHLMWYYKLNPGLTERDLIFLDETVEALPPDNLPRTKLFRDAGTAVFRSGFGADDFVFVFRCGAFFNHHHFDQGAFFLQDRGVELLTESGRTDYYADPWYRKLFIQAGGHNCVLVDENPESQKAGDFLHDVPAWRDYASITDFIGFEGGACVSGRLDPLYKGKLSNLRRTVLFVEPRTIVLIDEASGAEDTRRINLLFHAPERDDIALVGGGAAVERSGVKLSMRTIGPESLASEILKRPMTINEFNRSNAVTMKARGYLRQTATLGWGGDTTVVANIMSTDTAVLASLNERIADEYALVNLAGNDYMINRTGGRPMSGNGVVTDALVYAVRSDGYVAVRATSLTADGENVLTADAPVTVEVKGGGRVTYSAGSDVTAAFRRSSKPKKVLIDGSASKDWQYRNGSLVINLRAGRGEIELR